MSNFIREGGLIINVSQILDAYYFPKTDDRESILDIRFAAWNVTDGSFESVRYGGQRADTIYAALMVESAGAKS